MKPIYDILTAIADRHLAIPTLLERRSDRLDFHEVSVWGVKNALWYAYQAGRNASAEGEAGILREAREALVRAEFLMRRVHEGDHRALENLPSAATQARSVLARMKNPSAEAAGHRASEAPVGPKSETPHTPEPWLLDGVTIVNPNARLRKDEHDATGGAIARVAGLGNPSPEGQKANARRIVAAVNACRGMSIESLEAGIIRNMRAALTWLLDDLADAGEDRNAETGEEYDSVAFARTVLRDEGSKLPHLIAND